MESVFQGLRRGLALKSVKDLEKILTSINYNKLTQSQFQALTVIMIEAHKSFKYFYPPYLSLLSHRMAPAATSSLQYSINMLEACEELMPVRFEQSLTELSRFIATCHPLELSVNSAITLINALQNASYTNEIINDFINQSILQSSFPPGRFGQEFTCALAWFYTENQSKSNEEVWEIIEKQVIPYKFQRFSYEHRIDYAHALITMQQREVSPYIVKLLHDVNWKILETTDLVKFLQVLGSLKILRGIPHQFSEGIWKNINRKCEEIRMSGKIFEKREVSTFQEDIGLSLREMGIKNISEFEIFDPYYLRVDFFIDPDIVIEAQGPYHYLKPYMKESAKTMIKNKVLEKLGYRVVSVPYFYWMGLDQTSKICYLSKHLRED